MNTSDERLRVCLDARFPTGVVGGVEQILIGLASGLCSHPNDRFDFSFLALQGQSHWLEPYVRGPCSIVTAAQPPFRESTVGRLKARWRVARLIANHVPAIGPLRRPGPDHSDGTVERAGVEVMHFPGQHAFVTELPTIYQPHDLQHVHLPGSFTPRERQFRDASYRLHCERAALVVMMTEWGKQDLIERLGLDESKVRVVPGAPILQAYADPDPVAPEVLAQRFDLTTPFVLYPAQLWPHKNHLVLLQALAILRERGVRVPLVCCGSWTPLIERIQRTIERLDLTDQVRFVGFVSPAEIQGLYAAARALAFPSTFEGWGMPILEAYEAGIPVACSNLPVLREVAGDAALTFDPADVEDIAAAIERLWIDEDLHETLIERGSQRVKRFTWKKTAGMFRALYAEVAGREFDAEEEV